MGSLFPIRLYSPQTLGEGENHSQGSGSTGAGCGRDTRAVDGTPGLWTGCPDAGPATAGGLRPVSGDRSTSPSAGKTQNKGTEGLTDQHGQSQTPD